MNEVVHLSFCDIILAFIFTLETEDYIIICEEAHKHFINLFYIKIIDYIFREFIFPIDTRDRLCIEVISIILSGIRNIFSIIFLIISFFHRIQVLVFSDFEFRLSKAETFYLFYKNYKFFSGINLFTILWHCIERESIGNTD